MTLQYIFLQIYMIKIMSAVLVYRLKRYYHCSNTWHRAHAASHFACIHLSFVTHFAVTRVLHIFCCFLSVHCKDIVEFGFVSLLRTLIFNKEQIKHLTQINPMPPTLKAQLKLHKAGNPIRPVINNRSAPS